MRLVDDFDLDDLTRYIRGAHNFASLDSQGNGVNPSPSRQAVGKRWINYASQNSGAAGAPDFSFFGPDPAVAADFGKLTSIYFVGNLDYQIYLSQGAAVAADSAVLKAYIGDGVNPAQRIWIKSGIWALNESNKVVVDGSTINPVVFQALSRSLSVAGTENVFIAISMRGWLTDWR